ncbi:Extracellular exo-alpha-L-arabinofuranosidase [Hypsizygus marmoreus]|uniref:Extracellular exo-alpha-L-arabinofuranosidase n=1 Tax=Hypsizygus marmoreus TaxID=39966 RepID=A0A369JXX6_HYPMA|nr:Extracellular exo-alpha-L-arabinofuranosidase [Hypsizygus marmoreus]
MLPVATLSFLSLSLLSLPALAADRVYKVVNRCPEDIPLYIGGELQGNLPAKGGSVTKTLSDLPGFFYTTANGGNVNGAGTALAGFYGNDDYYYLVVDPAHMNTGISITPVQVPSKGFCGTASCTTANCTTAFQKLPTSFPSPPTSFPAITESAPIVPLYACPSESDMGYLIEFCPGGVFPPQTTSPLSPSQTVAIHPNGNTAKCVDVRGAIFLNGTPVQIHDCNKTAAQKWVVRRGDTKVQLKGTNFCLDAGLSPANGVGMKIWTCHDNLPAQAWYYTEDNRIALAGKGLCLDLPNGVLTNSNQLQTWKCTDKDNFQVWTTTS